MTYQTVNLGTAPTGAGGDTFRSTGAKLMKTLQIGLMQLAVM